MVLLLRCYYPQENYMATPKKLGTATAKVEVAKKPVSAKSTAVSNKAGVSKTKAPAAKIAPKVTASPTKAPATKVAPKVTATPTKAPAAKKAVAAKPKPRAADTTATVAKASRPTTRSTARKSIITPEQRANYIEVAAFYIAEQRGFAPGNPMDDWVAAEAEIDRLIASGKFAQ